MAQYMYDKDGNRTVILSEEEEQKRQRKEKEKEANIGCLFILLFTIGGLWASHEEDKEKNALWCAKLGVNDSELCEVLVQARITCEGAVSGGDVPASTRVYKVKPKYHKYFGKTINCSKVLDK